MAGEVGHVVYATRLLTHLKKKVRGENYWIGTLFPDIRHQGIVSRRRTHPADVTLQTLAGKTDFETGMRVHAWIDATRLHYLSEANIKEVLPWHPFVPHAFKLLEDELLYDSFDDWDLIRRLLNKIYDEELFFVNSEKRVRTWHTVLQDYFAKAPNDISRYRLSLAIGLSKNSAEEMNNVVTHLRKHKRALKIIEQFLLHLEYLLQ